MPAYSSVYQVHRRGRRQNGSRDVLLYGVGLDFADMINWRLDAHMHAVLGERRPALVLDAFAGGKVNPAVFLRTGRTWFEREVADAAEGTAGAWWPKPV